MSLSLSKYLATNRGDVYLIFRKLRGWNFDIKDHSLYMERDGLIVSVRLVGPPVIHYRYKRNEISIYVSPEMSERVIRQDGDVQVIQRQVDKLIGEKGA